MSRQSNTAKLNTELTAWFQRQRFAPALTVSFYAFGAISVHAALFEALIFGRVPSDFKIPTGISETTIYWSYISALAYLSLAVDIAIFRFIQRTRRKPVGSVQSPKSDVHQ
jgi:hypothetical protein